MAWYDMANILPIVGNLMFWFIFIMVMLFTIVGILIIRRNRRFTIPVIEQINLGNGKTALNSWFKPRFRKQKMKAGWFGKNRAFFNLYDSGTLEMVINDGRKIQKGSSALFHDIDGERGLIVTRKSDDTGILVPVKRFQCVNTDILTEIAPADYRDASVDIFENNTKETAQQWEKIIQYVALGLIAIILFISIVMIIQYSKWSITEAKDLVLQASRDFATKTVTTSTAP